MRQIALEIEENADQVMRELKLSFSTNSDAEVIRKALAFTVLGVRNADESGVVALGEGKSQIRVGLQV